MRQRTVLIFALVVGGFNLGGSRPMVDMDWSAKPIKGSFQSNEPIVMSYRFINNSKLDVLVPKLVDPNMSVRFRLTDPQGLSMRWNGARFTFKYDRSDLVTVKPGQEISGTFQIPTACPDEHRIEKGGFCFTKKGPYTGTAAFQLGLNAFYHRDQIRGRVAEGPYWSHKFMFNVQ